MTRANRKVYQLTIAALHLLGPSQHQQASLNDETEKYVASSSISAYQSVACNVTK